MTSIERKQAELAQLIAEHRVIAAQTENDIERAIANQCIDPAYGLKPGDIFHLVRSSHDGYFYIVTEGGCRCNAYVYRHTCRHVQMVRNFCRENLGKRDWKIVEAEQIAEEVLGEFAQDLVQHIEDELRTTASCTCVGCGHVARTDGFCSCGMRNAA